MESIIELRKKTGVLVAAHRGTSGGNIPPNSIAAFDIALKEGADILEIVSSFNHYTIRSMKEKCPELKTGALYADGIINAVDYVADVVRADALHPGWTKIFYPNYLEDCRRRNMLVHVWTINNEEDMRRCCEMGLDAIITNYPDVARKVVDEYQLN